MPGFVLLMRDRLDGDAAIRLGITVTKKIGNAVVRNRMKRRFRMLARDVIADSGQSGCDYVMIGRESGVERDFALLRTELAKALAKIAKQTELSKPAQVELDEASLTSSSLIQGFVKLSLSGALDQSKPAPK